MATVDRRDLTAEQTAAIATRDVSIALSAGAGCGKTYVLTERYLSHLERELAARQTDVSHLVAITFTDRAAREMRDRIRTKCRERLLSAADEDEARHWAHLVRELESARITTIHAFCGALLRSHAVEAGIDPRFAILEPMHAATLIGEQIDHELRKLLRRRAPELVDLLLRYDLDRVREMIEILVRERAKLRFDEWLDRSPADLVPRWEAFYRDEALPSALRRVARSPAAAAVLEIATDDLPVDDRVMLMRCRELARLLPALESCGDPSSMLDEIARHARIERRKGAPWTDATREVFKSAAESLREQARSAKRLVGIDVAAAERAAQTSLDLIRVAAPVVDAYEARKRELGSLDFDDLLMRARDLMCAHDNEELRRRTAAGIRLLLVDEFQDTDPVQADLVRALCGDVALGKLFFVGDFKQSIYRFRRADPEVFRRLEAEVPPRGQLPLSLNFRSQPAILDFVNALFHDQFERYQPLRAHRAQTTPTPAVEFLWVEPDDDHAKATVADARKREAEWIARRLRAMLDDETPMVVDRDAEKTAAKNAAPVARQVRQGDIVLLFRAMSDVEHYEAALRRYEIDYYVVGGQAFYAQQEIFDVVNLLRAVECAEDAVSLAGALRSAFFSLDDETLFWLSMHPDGLAEGLLAARASARLSRDRRRRATFAAETLTALRERKDRLPIAELLNEALARTGYDATILAEFLGERKLANLRKLVDRARSMDRAGVFTLSDFVTELADSVARQPDEALAATHAEKTDVVRLMSIHQSKGLEFPVVVVADIERKPRGPVSPLAVHPTLGPIARLDAADAGAATDMLALYQCVEADHDALERTRLFYVAATRAADYLILSASVKEIDQPQEDWRRLLAARFDLATGRLKGALPPGWAEPLVRVTTSEPLLTRPASRGHGRPRLDRIVETAAALRAEGNVFLPAAVGPVEVDRRARRRFSFSSLSGELITSTTAASHDTDEELESSAGYEGDPLELGTLVHESLAAIDWREAVDAATIVARVADRRLVVDDRRLAAAREMIARFAGLSRARAIGQAKAIQQEIEFLLAWPRESAAKANCLYLQGFIDCLYEDAHGGWHLIDFKTNRVTRETLASTAALYEMQMYIYALAAERALGVRPAEATLVFLRTGDEYSFRWTPADGDRLAAAVNAALAAARQK